MYDVHGQWICNSLLREFRDELDCYHLIDGEYAGIMRRIMALRIK